MFWNKNRKKEIRQKELDALFVKANNSYLIESLQESIEDTKEWLELRERQFNEQLRKPFVEDWNGKIKNIQIDVEYYQKGLIDDVENISRLRDHIRECEKLISNIKDDGCRWDKDKIEEVRNTLLDFLP